MITAVFRALRRGSFLMIILALALAGSFAPHCLAQAVAVAHISGTVNDPSGAAVPGAQVQATHTGTQLVRATVTDVEGRYTLPELPVGPYKLEVKASGFRDYVQSGIELQVGKSVEINVRMQVGSVSQVVEVTAVLQMTEMRESGVAQVIDQRKINELPLNGRQATQLVLLSGAAVQPPGGNSMVGSKNYASSSTISVGGGQINGTAYVLDGGDHTDTMTNVNLPFPFPDALQEFSVETSALSARFGTHPGATVNAVTKSGTNQLHGDVFEYLRNGNTNARPFFAVNHDTLKRNTFGGTMGGKAITDKLFFFGGYQGLRNRSDPPTTTSTIPTAAALAGDFSSMTSAACNSGTAVTLIDPLPNSPFPIDNNRIPPQRFNPAALKLASGFLPISQADACGKVVYGIPQTGDENQIITRLDWTKSSTHSVSGRYFLAGFANPSVYDGKSLLTTTQPGNLERVQSVSIGDTYSIRSTVLNSFHFTFSRRRDDRGPAENQIGPNAIGINMFQKVPNFLLVTVGVALPNPSGFNIGCGTCAPGHFNVNTWQFADDVDVVRGRHNIAFGINFVRTQNNLISGFNENGTFTFNTSNNNATNTIANSTGFAIADFLIGRVSTFNQSNPTPDDLRQSIFSAYAQDSFKLNPRLTLNAGLRWEPLVPNTDKYGRGTFLDFAAFAAGTTSNVFTNAPLGLFFPGDAGFPRSLWNRHLANFGPRVGLAFNPHGDGRDTFRVSAGILYDSTELFFDERKTTNPPYGSSVGLTAAPSGVAMGPFDNPYKNYPGGSPFPAPNLFPLGGVYIQMPRDTKPTYLGQWNASYQRQFAGDWMASITYMGNKTTHLWVGSEINPSIFIPGSTLGTQQRRVLYLQDPTKGQFYGSINQADEGANAHYNALLLSLQHRFSHGFTLLTNYTNSNCVTDFDFTGELGGSPNSVPGNRSADRGPCNFDYRHVFNASMVATSSVKSDNLWVSRLLSNWQIAPVIRAISGRAITVTSGRDNSQNGTGNDRPNQLVADLYQATAACPVTGFCKSYLTAGATAFAQNPTGTNGNVGRDSVRGPGAVNVDMNVTRSFPFRERFRMAVRVDAFNVINHANFDNPDTNLSHTSTFGLITGTAPTPGGSVLLPAAGDPRIFQFALKLFF